MLEKTKAFFDSMTLEQLTEHLESIGIKFIEKGENSMYNNLVFIKHENSNNKFLFKVPMNITLKASEKVFVDTIQGECMGECVSDSFIVGGHETVCIMVGAGAYYPLKEVIGYAHKQEGYRCIEFALASIPF